MSKNMEEWLDTISVHLDTVQYLSDNYSNTVWQLFDVMDSVSSDYETMSKR